MSSTNPLLNEDILPEVFKFLTVRDRKNARLVCKPWLTVCNYEKFTKTEAFFVCNVYDYQTAVDVLKNCDRKSLNLKFDQSHINEESLLLWKACGKRIESLNFCECTFLLGVVPQIFKLCVNLTEFILSDGEFVGKRKFHHHPFAVAPILLPKKKMTRSKLTTLSLESFTLELKSQDIQCFASTFPSLRTLKMNIELDDHVRPTDGSSQSPNFAVLLRLFETHLKSLETLDLHFPIKHQMGVVDIHLAFIRQHEGSSLKPVPLSLEPFFKIHKNLTENPYLKHCVSIRVDGTFRTPYSTPDLTILARLIEENPLMEKLDMHYLVLENATKFCTFFAALVKSRLKQITLGCTSWPDSFTAELDTILKLEIEDLPINYTVRRLRVYSTTESLCSLCLKYFGNVEHLTAKPGDPNLIFKSQPHLKRLSIEWDEEECSAQAKNTIENLEFLEVRGTTMNFLSGYRFPNLKYFDFFYEDDCLDSDDSTDLLETNTSLMSVDSCSTEILDQDVLDDDDPDANDDNEIDYDNDDEWETDDSSDIGSANPFSAIVLVLNDIYGSGHILDLSDRNSEGSSREGKDSEGTLLGFLAMDLDERAGGDRESSSLQDSTDPNSDADEKLFVGRIDNITSFVRENAPKLEGFRFNCYSNFTFSTAVYSAFFKACSNFAKLRYLSVSRTNNPLRAADVKAEMLKYLPLCPLLRAAWFDSRTCKIAVYYNAVTNKIESSDDYLCIDGIIDLRNFYDCGR